jgi:hypothetical protein
MEPKPAAVAKVPLTLSEIPGMGPIRVRALNKAGINSVCSLKNASLEQLTSIPGITPIKASEFVAFLAPYSVSQIERAEEAATAATAAASQLIQWDTLDEVSHVLPLTVEAARSLGAIIKLLTSAHGPMLRNKLVAALELLSSECQAVIVNAVTVHNKDAEKSLRRIRKSTESLIEISGRAEFDRKEQSRLVDELIDLAAWIALLKTTHSDQDARKQTNTTG